MKNKKKQKKEKKKKKVPAWLLFILGGIEKTNETKIFCMIFSSLDYLPFGQKLVD